MILAAISTISSRLRGGSYRFSMIGVAASLVSQRLEGRSPRY